MTSLNQNKMPKKWIKLPKVVLDKLKRLKEKIAKEDDRRE